MAFIAGLAAECYPAIARILQRRVLEALALAPVAVRRAHARYILAGKFIPISSLACFGVCLPTDAPL